MVWTVFIVAAFQHALFIGIRFFQMASGTIKLWPSTTQIAGLFSFLRHSWFKIYCTVFF